MAVTSRAEQILYRQPQIRAPLNGQASTQFWRRESESRVRVGLLPTLDRRSFDSAASKGDMGL